MSYHSLGEIVTKYCTLIEQTEEERRSEEYLEIDGKIVLKDIP
jgi:hypothetical protein